MKELSQSKITSHVEYLAVIKFLYRYEKDLMFMLLLLKINYSLTYYILSNAFVD